MIETGHSATLLGGLYIVIFGGWGKGGNQNQEEVNNPNAYTIHILDTQSMMWWVPRKMGKKPMKHLYNHCACPSMDGRGLDLFGGFDGRQSLNDYVSISIDFGGTHPVDTDY